MANQADFVILGETADFLAVDKPAGMLVHPTRPGGPSTLWDGLRALLGFELATGGQVSLINRLDRETSGIVVVAKTSQAAREAGLAMQAGQIGKEYLGLVFGWPQEDVFDIRAPIVRKGAVMPSKVHLERMVHPAGAAAWTRIEVRERRNCSRGRFALVAARPLTGRTHQIRVHLAAAGFPIVGDKLYARGSTNYLAFIAGGWTEALEKDLWLSRHALHCTRMRVLGETWSSPLPPDLQDFLDRSEPALSMARRLPFGNDPGGNRLGQTLPRS